MDRIKKKAANTKDAEKPDFIDEILGDVSKASATKQLILGVSSGWATGFLSKRIGKAAALTVGGGIILLQIANDKGYLTINWNKINNKIDKAADKVEEKITGQGPSWMDKVERYVDRKIDKAEEVVKKQKTKTKHWYSSITGDTECRLKEVHIFLISFVSGIAVGIATS